MCPESPTAERSSARRIAATSFIGRHVVLVVASAAFLLCQRWALAYFWEIWTIPDYYYSHGVIVPLLSAIMIWMNRRRLRAVGMRGAWVGAPIVLLAGLAQVIGLACGFGIMQSAAFLLMLYGALIAVLGIQAVRILFLPVLFLVTMMPLPQIILDGVTARYQIASTSVAAMALRIWDSSVAHHGNIITAGGLPGPLTVGVPCSGLKLLITLLMCTWFLSYVLEGSWKRKVALIALSLPFSLVINFGRVILIGYVGLRTHSEAAIRSFHDLSGYIGLVACAALVLGSAWLMGLRRFRVLSPDDEGQGSPTRGGTKSPGLSPAGLTATALMLAAAVVGACVSDLYDLPKGKLRVNVPVSFGRWTGYEAPVDPHSRRLLDKADFLSRLYVSVAPGDQPVFVFMEAALDTSMLHDPGLCLPGAGTVITEERPIALDLGWRETVVRASMMRTAGASGRGLIIYWYGSDQGALPSKNAVNRYTLAARLSDLKRMAANPFSLSQVKKDIRARQITWIRFVVVSAEGTPDVGSLRRFIMDLMANTKETDNEG